MKLELAAAKAQHAAQLLWRSAEAWILLQRDKQIATVGVDWLRRDIIDLILVQWKKLRRRGCLMLADHRQSESGRRRGKQSPRAGRKRLR